MNTTHQQLCEIIEATRARPAAERHKLEKFVKQSPEMWVAVLDAYEIFKHGQSHQLCGGIGEFRSTNDFLAKMHEIRNKLPVGFGLSFCAGTDISEYKDKIKYEDDIITVYHLSDMRTAIGLKSALNIINYFCICDSQPDKNMFYRYRSNDRITFYLVHYKKIQTPDNSIQFIGVPEQNPASILYVDDKNKQQADFAIPSLIQKSPCLSIPFEKNVFHAVPLTPEENVLLTPVTDRELLKKPIEFVNKYLQIGTHPVSNFLFSSLDTALQMLVIRTSYSTSDAPTPVWTIIRNSPKLKKVYLHEKRKRLLTAIKMGTTSELTPHESETLCEEIHGYLPEIEKLPDAGQILVFCSIGNLFFLEKIKDVEKYVNIADKRGFPLLLVAIRSGNVELVKYLVKNGAVDNITDGSGNSPLLFSVIHGNVEMVRYFMEKFP